MKLSPPAAFNRPFRAAPLLAVLVLALTLTCVGRAYAVASVPSHFETVYTIMSPGESAPISWPTQNSPISLTAAGINPSPGALTVGFIHAVYSVQGAGVDDRFLRGNGQNGDGSPAIPFQNGNNADILTLSGDALKLVTVTPTGSTTDPSRFKIVNTTQSTVTVVIEMIW